MRVATGYARLPKCRALLRCIKAPRLDLARIEARRCGSAAPKSMPGWFSPHEQTNGPRRIRNRPSPALRRAQGGLSAERLRHLPEHQMGADGVLPRRLLHPALRALGSRPERAEPGGADRFPEPALLFLLHRAVAAGGLLLHRPPDHRRDGAVPDERDRRPHLVRLSLPADGVDRPVLRGRALHRGRPPRAHEEVRRQAHACAASARSSPSIRSGSSSPGGPAAPGCSTSPMRRPW